MSTGSRRLAFLVMLLPKLLGNCDCLLLGDIKPHCGAKKKCAKNAKSSSHLEFNMTGHASCWVPLCTNNFRNSPGLAVYRIPKARCIVSECVRLLRNVNLKLNADSTRICIPLVFLEVKLPQAHLPSASLFLFFFLSSPPSVLLFQTVLTPLEHSTSLSSKFVYIHVPQNNPINAHEPSLGPGFHSFPKCAIKIIAFVYLGVETNFI